MGGRAEFDWDAHNIEHLARHGVSHIEFERAIMRDSVFMDVRDEAVKIDGTPWAPRRSFACCF